ncbi:MAG: CmcI family methyltransferase [Nitrospiraceae bacterium]
MKTWEHVHEAGRMAFRRFRYWRQQRIVSRFARLYHGSPLREDLTKGTTWRDGATTWLGVPCEKCPLDLWIYQELLFRTKPDVIVECGVNYGGSTLYLASLMDLLKHGEIIGIDITLSRLYPGVKDHPRISLFESSSTDQAIVDIVKQRVAGRRTMVILDSDHSLPHVRRELELYADLVSKGCYLVVEDTIVNGHPVSPEHGPGPFEAVQEFVAARNDFQIDRHQHKYLMTYHPNGYLLRI